MLAAIMVVKMTKSNVGTFLAHCKTSKFNIGTFLAHRKMTKFNVGTLLAHWHRKSTELV